MSELGSGPIEGSYWVSESLAAGRTPGSRSRRRLQARLQRLLDAGVGFFMDLTEHREKALRPYDLALRQEAQAAGRVVQYVRAPIPDFEAPTVEQMCQILDRLDAALSEGQVVYLHCYAGEGRTGTVVGCYLVRHGRSGQGALDEIARLRRGLDSGDRPSPITDGQRRMVRRWAAYDSARRA
jgi:protein-tyrosine phosphatase